jgi:hypothetical protein
MNYGSGKIFRIEFGAEVSFSKNKLVFNLLSELGEPLGITLAFNHKIIEHIDAQAFIRLKAKQKQIGFEAGFTLPF